MVSKVRLVYSVDLYVKHESEDDLCEWLAETTPQGACEMAHEQTGGYPEESYDEEIICRVREDSDYDLDITKEEA